MPHRREVYTIVQLSYQRDYLSQGPCLCPDQRGQGPLIAFVPPLTACQVDANGVSTGEFTSYSICGAVRSMVSNQAYATVRMWDVFELVPCGFMDS